MHYIFLKSQFSSWTICSYHINVKNPILPQPFSEININCTYTSITRKTDQHKDKRTKYYDVLLLIVWSCRHRCCIVIELLDRLSEGGSGLTELRNWTLVFGGKSGPAMVILPVSTPSDFIEQDKSKVLRWAFVEAEFLRYCLAFFPL